MLSPQSLRASLFSRFFSLGRCRGGNLDLLHRGDRHTPRHLSMRSIIMFIALPILVLVSIPLILSAAVTISFALIALTLRLLMAYIELVFGSFLHLLSVSTSSVSSLLAFGTSNPSITASGRSSGEFKRGTQRRKDSLPAWSDRATLGNHRDKSYTRSTVVGHSSPTSFHGFPISDERRDFEGVGGWRSYPSKPHVSHEKPPFGSSSSSINDVDQSTDTDEHAWLSLNNRLELPSQVITLSTITHAGSTSTSPSWGSDLRNGHNFQNLTGADPTSDGHGSRNHHRSLTTSSLVTSDLHTGTGLSLALLTRPDNAPNRSRRPQIMTLQSFAQSHDQSRAPRWFQKSGPFTSPYLSSFGEPSHSSGGNVSTASDRSGGYFSLRKPGSSGGHFSGKASPNGSGYTTLGAGVSTEERETSLSSARLMAHYPTSPRHRRRSIGGPARTMAGERAE